MTTVNREVFPSAGQSNELRSCTTWFLTDLAWTFCDQIIKLSIDDPNEDEHVPPALRAKVQNDYLQRHLLLNFRTWRSTVIFYTFSQQNQANPSLNRNMELNDIDHIFPRGISKTNSFLKNQVLLGRALWLHNHFLPRYISSKTNRIVVREYL